MLLVRNFVISLNPNSLKDDIVDEVPCTNPMDEVLYITIVWTHIRVHHSSRDLFSFATTNVHLYIIILIQITMGYCEGGSNLKAKAILQR